MASAFQHSYDNRDFFYYTIDLWDLTNGRCIASFPPFDGSSGDLSPIGLWLAFDPAGRFLFVAGNQVAGEPWVQLFESGTGNRIGNHKVAGDRSMIWKIQFDERGRLGVLVGSMKWYLKFFDLSRFGQLVPAETHPLTTPLATRTLPLFSWDFTLTAFSVSDACSEVCATSTGGTIVRVAGVPNAFSPDNQMLVTLLDKTFFGKEAYGLGLWAIPPQGEVV
jgi:WD40 repeat protein